MGNLTEKGPLSSVGGLLVNTQKNNLRNGDESGCGWLYEKIKPTESENTSKKNKKTTAY